MIDELLSALGAVGYLLDTPGAYARGYFAGKPGERVDGRELLESLGILGPNREGLDVGDVGGFLAEMALDPLNLIPVGAIARSATKAAKSAQRLRAAESLKNLGAIPRSELAESAFKSPLYRPMYEEIDQLVGTANNASPSSSRLLYPKADAEGVAQRHAARGLSDEMSSALHDWEEIGPDVYTNEFATPYDKMRLKEADDKIESLYQTIYDAGSQLEPQYVVSKKPFDTLAPLTQEQAMAMGLHPRNAVEALYGGGRKGIDDTMTANKISKMGAVSDLGDDFTPDEYAGYLGLHAAESIAESAKSAAKREQATRLRDRLLNMGEDHLTPRQSATLRNASKRMARIADNMPAGERIVKQKWQPPQWGTQQAPSYQDLYDAWTQGISEDLSDIFPRFGVRKIHDRIKSKQPNFRKTMRFARKFLAPSEVLGSPVESAMRTQSDALIRQTSVKGLPEINPRSVLPMGAQTSRYLFDQPEVYQKMTDPWLLAGLGYGTAHNVLAHGS
jgi:hypothetical protein